MISAACPNDFGYGECFGFAQFIGYLLSGDVNPHGNWISYPTVAKAGGLRVGDIIRVEYEYGGEEYRHSVVVYSVDGDEVLFIQAHGGAYNRLGIRRGYNDGCRRNITSVSVFRRMKDIRICRSPLNE